MEKFEQTLQKLGFTERGAKLYLSILNLGSTTMVELARTSELKRPTAYVLIEELIQKGFVRRTRLGRRTYYAAQSPTLLVEKVKELQLKVENLVPQLTSLMHKQSGRPRVEILEGKEGIRQIYKEARVYNDIIYWSDIEQVYKVMGDDLEAELAHQDNANIPFRDIESDTPFGRRYARRQNAKKKTHKTKILKGRRFQNDNMIYGDTLVIFSVKAGNLFAIKITSKEIAATYRTIFESLWDNL